MKKILFTLLFVPMVAIAKDDLATFESYCLTLQRLTEVLEKHEEKPMMTFVSYRAIGEQGTQYPTVMFVNPKTYTYTIAEKIREDFYCVVSVGTNLKPYKKIQ